MALTPFQQAVSNLARSMGLKGEAEKRVYSTPEYQRLHQQFFPVAPTDQIAPEQQASEQALLIEAINRLRTMFGQPIQNLDLAPFQQQLSSINAALTAPAQLPMLQQSDLDALAALKAAEDAELMSQQEDLRGRLTADLFGRGVQQSTIAGEAAGEFAEALGRSRASLSGAQAQRGLNVRQLLAQLQQGNLALAGQNAIGQGNMAIAGFTSENDALAQLINQLIAATGQQQQVGVQRAGLNENQRQFQMDFGERARQFDEQMAAQRRSWLTSLIGIGASLASAIPGVGPAIGAGIGSLGSIFSKGGGGAITGAGSQWPQN